MKEDTLIQRLHPAAQTPNTLIRWQAIFAGAFVALLVYATLTALGVAIGGVALSNVIQGDTAAQTLGIGAGLWVVLSVLVSLFAGGYVAGRVGGIVALRVGRIEGLVVAGLFFAFMFSAVGSMVGTLGAGAGRLAGAAGGAVADVAQTPEVRGVVNRVIGDLNFNVPSEQAIGTIVSRMVRGDEQGALNYLSRETGISRAEAQQRIDSIRAEFNETVTAAGEAAASALRWTGWVLFGALLLGSLSAMFGGGYGARMSLKHPLDESDYKAIREERAA